jgi:tRNA(Arg) A34 adenosine deaminase TadA
MLRGDGGPFGAVVVRGTRIVGRGWNRVLCSSDPTAHAEVEAIRDACARLGTHDLSGCEIFSSCEPCPMCLSAIHWARLDAVHQACTGADAAALGFDDAAIAEQLAASPDDRSLPVHRLMREEGLELFDEWRALPDAVLY